MTKTGVRCPSCNAKVGEEIAGVFLGTCRKCGNPVTVITGTQTIRTDDGTYLVSVTRRS